MRKINDNDNKGLKQSKILDNALIRENFQRNYVQNELNRNSEYIKWMKNILRRSKEVGKRELPISAVIIDEKDIKSYLNIEFEAVNILNDRNRPNLEFYEISKDVNKPNNNDISLIQKV